MTVRRVGFATSDRYRDLVPSDRLAAALLRQQGFEVVPLVWTETQPSVVGCDLVVIRSVWDYHLHVELFLEWVGDVAKRTQVLNSPATIRWNADKRYLFDLENAGLVVPRMVLLEAGSQVDVAQALLAHEFHSAVVKPVVSASAFETYVVNTQTAPAIAPRINQVLRQRTMLMQEFVPEITTLGEWSLMFFGGRYSHAVRKLPKSGDFRVQSEHGGRHQLEVPGTRIREIAQQVVDQFAAETLYARIDVVEGKSSPLIMEVELIDPELFLTDEPAGAQKFVDVLRACVKVM